MKQSILLISTIFLLKTSCFAFLNDSSFIETPVTLKTTTGEIFGTLTTPKKFNKVPVALIIAGSGPTDRDGNNPFAKNENLKKLAYALVEKGIASLRFDKRGIAESKPAVKSEADLRFEDYVNDAKEWILLLKKDKRFTQVVIIGHSEGSLIGMIAAENNVDKYVSIAGAGQSADKILKMQLGSQPKTVQDLCYPIIDSLKKGNLVTNVNPMLFSLFRPSVQPYMISWFKYDPQTEIKKLKIPVLILQGTNDIQVSADDAKFIATANPKAKLILIEKMNHIFRTVEGDAQTNLKTYNDASLPISTELVNDIANFIIK